MSKSKDRVRALLASLCLIAALSACGVQNSDEKSAGGKATPAPSSETIEGVPPVQAEAQEAEELVISIFSSDADLQELVEYQTSITSGSETDIVKTAITELQKKREDNSISLWAGIHVLSVELKNGIATLDIHIPDEERLGAPGELLLVESLKRTLFQFSFITGIDVLVVGEAVESLMGHVELDHPILK